MKQQYLNLVKMDNLIDGVIMRQLTIHRDKTGTLIETLRSDWLDVYSEEISFKMQYMSITPSFVARDEDKWHVHKYQKDRFICISGRIVTAVYDARENSKTKGVLNLFTMGPKNENEMYMLVIPEGTYHGFMVVSQESGYLLNFPTQLYNPDDEGRVNHTDKFNWKEIREDFANK